MWVSRDSVRGEGGLQPTYDFGFQLRGQKQSITISTHRFEYLTTLLGLPLQPIFASYFLKEHAASLLFPKKSAQKTQICIFQK